MNFAEELFLNQQGIYFRMLDELEAKKDRGLKLLDMYFDHKDGDQKVFKMISDQLDQQSEDIKKQQAKIKEFTESRFSQKELELLKLEYSLRS